jgi:hypothetical protein
MTFRIILLLTLALSRKIAQKTFMTFVQQVTFPVQLLYSGYNFVHARLNNLSTILISASDVTKRNKILFRFKKLQHKKLSVALHLKLR